MNSRLPQNAQLVLDSITTLGPDSAGRVVLAGSHAGAYCGMMAAKACVGGIVLHDAGIGLDQAGIAGLDLLASAGIPAAAIDFRSARIGDGEDCFQRGIISAVNSVARVLGIAAGITAREALAKMLVAPTSLESILEPSGLQESRLDWTIVPGNVSICLLDSNALVNDSDIGKIIITGSHGGLLGGRPETAVRVPVFAAAYNDAGVGIDQAGISRLAALEARGIGGVTVSAMSARIGDSRSTLNDGIISHINPTAGRYGAETGISMRECTQRFVSAWHALHGAHNNRSNP